jgi:hypothetical protein
MAADSVLVTNLVLQIKGGMMAVFIFRQSYLLGYSRYPIIKACKNKLKTKKTKLALQEKHRHTSW